MGWLFKMILWLVRKLPLDTLPDTFEGMESTSLWLGYFNYFVPVNKMLAITTVWLGLCLAYRTYRVIKRIFFRYMDNYTKLL